MRQNDDTTIPHGSILHALAELLRLRPRDDPCDIGGLVVKARQELDALSAGVARLTEAEAQGVNGYLALQAQCDAWRVAAELLRATIEDLTCDGCEYGDDCPRDAMHYRCTACTLNEALATAKRRAWEVEKCEP